MTVDVIGVSVRTTLGYHIVKCNEKLHMQVQDEVISVVITGDVAGLYMI